MTIVNLSKHKIVAHKTFNDSDYKHMSEDKTVRYVGFRKYSESYYAQYKRLEEERRSDKSKQR